MKVTKKRLKGREGEIALTPESLDDLWHLERIIEKGDLVSGSSERKVKGEEGRKAERIKVWVEIEAEKAFGKKFIMFWKKRSGSLRQETRG